MFPEDIGIWERFLEKFGEEYLGFDYDIKVGSGVLVEKSVEENYKRMVEILSKYRIDVVGHRKDRVEIIEVKPEASTVAIGQIEVYLALYKRDKRPEKPVRGVIVTDRELPDMRYLTNLLGFDYYVI